MIQARPPPTPPPAAENEVVAALQLRRRLATAEQKLAVAESTAEIAASAQRDREALLTRQLELKLHAAQEKLRSEFDAELDRAKHAAVAQAERDAAELQLATSRAADSRVDQAYEEADFRVQEALREATERIRAAQLREDEAAEALSSAMERREQDRQELERAFARKAAEEEAAASRMWSSRLDESVAAARAEAGEVSSEQHAATRQALAESERQLTQTRQLLEQAEEAESEAQAALLDLEASSEARLREARSAHEAAAADHHTSISELREQHSAATDMAAEFNQMHEAAAGVEEKLRAHVADLELELAETRREVSEAVATTKADAAAQMTVAMQREQARSKEAIARATAEAELLRSNETALKHRIRVGAEELTAASVGAQSVEEQLRAAAQRERQLSEAVELAREETARHWRGKLDDAMSAMDEIELDLHSAKRCSSAQCTYYFNCL